MNDLLQLKGKFIPKSRDNNFGPPSLPRNTFVSVEHIESLLADLKRMREFWHDITLIEGALISVRYHRVIPKSRRIKGIFASSGITANSSIRGARFAVDEDKKKHLITHYIPIEILDESIRRIQATADIIRKYFGERITDKDLISDNLKSMAIDFDAIARTYFMQIVVDSYFVEKFDVLEYKKGPKDRTIISVYDTGIDTKKLLEKIDIHILSNRIIDNTTVLLMPDQLAALIDKAPYLISMAVQDLSELTKDEIMNIDTSGVVTIPEPSNEPTIGVIDTMFDERVYFSKWVDFKKMIDENIPIGPNDYRHGTMISSLIVDGPTINPDLDDGCGRFKVRHFGVATGARFSSFTIMRVIKELVASNKDIKVWNLSLGSIEEIENNFISPEAAMLDQIQHDNDVIFVISGTNKPRDRQDDMLIGAPADSLNSMVVNAVDLNNNPVSYARRGVVLSFFNKPDVSYFGGNSDSAMRVCDPNGECFVAGTSFAAPWISRKLAYLIHIMGLDREVAKALLIHSAIGWNYESPIEKTSLIGHGVVPTQIKDIVTCNSDEIRFVISGVSESYDTYNYSIPVPIYKDEYPFVAKATICYFPKCSRNQGVDYTNTELDLYFGRINNEGKIKDINQNNQSIEGMKGYINEEDAREYYRKWDNSKHISEVLKEKSRPRKVYTNRVWGISVKRKERLNPFDGKGVRFGLVVTLKEINGVNRVDAFIQQCILKGWLVNKLNVENQLDIYIKANEEIEFE